MATIERRLERNRHLTLPKIAAISAAAVTAAVGLAYWRAMTLVYPRRIKPRTTPATYGITNWRDVSFITADGLRLQGWFVPPDPESNGATIIAVHGIENNRGGMLPLTAPLIAAGYGALLFDLRNHGTSEGHVTSLGCREVLDVQAALDFTRQQPGVNPDRVGLIAHSMGTAPALSAAAREGHIAATVTISAYSSLADNITETIARFSGLPAFPFTPLILFFGERASGARLRDVRPVDEVAHIAPGAVFFIHGAWDWLISSRNSERLYAAAQEPKELYIVPKGTHNTVITAPTPTMQARISAFFTEHLGNG